LAKSSVYRQPAVMHNNNIVVPCVVWRVYELVAMLPRSHAHCIPDTADLFDVNEKLFNFALSHFLAELMRLVCIETFDLKVI